MPSTESVVCRSVNPTEAVHFLGGDRNRWSIRRPWRSARRRYSLPYWAPASTPMRKPSGARISPEERLAILIDLECMYRDNNRLERRLKKAQLHLAPTIEDFDFSTARGIDKTLVLELAQGAWIANHLNAIVSGLRVRERHSSDVRWVIQCVGWISPCNISGYHVFCMISDWRMPMVLIPNC